jgi:hypothetical protein
MRTGRLAIAVVLPALVGVLVAGSARPATEATALTGTVGPGFSISLKDGSGKPVKQLDQGDYTITVTDNSDDHNFHLTGPGVDRATNIDNTVAGQPEKFVWNVTLVDGVYKYKCDAHPSQMKGSFRVGAAPPPPPKLTAKVGPGKRISLKRGSAVVKSLVVGTYRVSVKDVTKKDNFHLLGPGVNRKTAVRGKSSVTWTVKFKIGKGTYRSDASKKLRRTFRIVAPSPPAP